MNRLFLDHVFATLPDEISVSLNEQIIYSGPGNKSEFDLSPRVGLNVLKVCLIKKSLGNFVYANDTIQFDSCLVIKELVIESRYFRSLLNQCGTTSIDLAQHPDFAFEQLPGATVLTMSGSCYKIEFEFPIKQWMQWHKHKRTLADPSSMYQEIKKELK